jgi:pimeloyl-ACP methyl ester carboxylesterase
MTSIRTSDEHLLDVDGIVLCAQTFGDPSDPSMLLIGGSEASMDWWDAEFCARLAAGGRYVIRYDTRDTGRSTTFPPGRPGYSGDALIGDAIGVLDAFGIATAHVVGMSMGGGIAQHLAVRHAERVRSLTLISTTPGGPAGPAQADLPPMSPKLAQQFAAGDPAPDWTDPDAVVAYYIAGEHAFAGNIAVDEDWVREVVGRAWDRSPSMASAQNHWQLDGEAIRDRLGEISAPTLVLHGTADPLLPYPHGEALAREIPGARLVPLTGMGHQMPPRQLWEVVIPEILAISAGGTS